MDFYLQFPDGLLPFLVIVQLYIREAPETAPIANNTIGSHNVSNESTL
jgi:hypothetical protein